MEPRRRGEHRVAQGLSFIVDNELNHRGQPPPVQFLLKPLKTPVLLPVTLPPWFPLRLFPLQIKVFKLPDLRIGKSFAGKIR